MSDFITMVNRITTELRRSNLTDEAKTAINDAIAEAAKDRLFLNEMRSVSFATVIGQEYYSDQGLVDIDAMWYLQGSTRYSLEVMNNITANYYAEGNAQQSLPELYSRSGSSVRLYPIPSTVTTIYMDGYGKLTPAPLVEDDDTNNWMTDGERYIRALAKRNLYRDIIQDYGQSRIWDAIAADERTKLELETGNRIGTGTLRATRF